MLKLSAFHDPGDIDKGYNETENRIPQQVPPVPVVES
jgi:hypothetical protein